MKTEDIKTQLSRIDASLAYGKLAPFGLIYCMLFLLPLMPLITIIMLIATAVDGMEWSVEMIFSVIGGNVFCVLLGALVVYIFVKNKRLKKRILLWLEDAVEIKAYSKKVDESYEGGGLPYDKVERIRVEFSFAGKSHKKLSTAKAVVGGREGYFAAFNKYADRKINILYSPKYDQVLILKLSDEEVLRGK